jgi:lipoate-protein ligase A
VERTAAFPSDTLDVFRRESPRPVEDLALEDLLLSRAAAGRAGFAAWYWRSPVLVLGHGQPAESVDLDACRADGIPVLRRRSGGTGVLHHHTLAVSLALPASHPWNRGIRHLYVRFLDALAAVLAARGVPVERPASPSPSSAPASRSPICFEDHALETLLVAGRKAVGGAQIRTPNAALVHAVLLLDLDAALHARAFGVAPERIVAAMAPLPPAAGPPGELAAAVTEALAGTLGLRVGEVPGPVPDRESLERYRDPHWAPVPPRTGSSARDPQEVPHAEADDPPGRHRALGDPRPRRKRR